MMNILPPAEQRRLILWLPVCFGLGIILYFSLPYEPGLKDGGAFLTASLAAAYFVRKRWRHSLFPLLIALVFVALGFSNAQFQAWRATAPVIESGLDTVWVRGRVEHIEPQQHGSRVMLTELDLWQPQRKKFPPAATPYRARITVRTAMEGVKPGDYVSFRGKLTPPPRLPPYPGSYDFARHAWFERIGAVGFSYTPLHIREAGNQHIVERVRHHVTSRILEYFPPDDPAGGIATALLTGDRGTIPQSLNQMVYISGLGHILSISGLHLAMVMAGFFFLLRAIMALSPYLALRYNIKKIAAGAALVAGFGYLLLSGSPVPAQRSYIMASLFFLAILVDRTGTPLRPVAWAALLVLVWQPEALLTPGFQMSYAAVIALIAAFNATPLFRPVMGEPSPLPRRLLLYIAALAFSSIIAGAATAPYAAYHFGRYSSYGLLANLLAVPLTSFWIMPWGMLALLLMPLGLEGLALAPMHWGLNQFIFIADLIASMEHSQLRIPLSPTWAIASFTLGSLWLCIWKTRLRLWSIPLVLSGAACIIFPPSPPGVIIDEKGKLFAIRDDKGKLVVNTRSSSRYARERWLEVLGEEKAILARDSNALQCDDTFCRAEGVIFLLQPEALEKACRPVKLFVNLIGNGQCATAEANITQADIRHHGSHAVWLSSPTPRIRHAAGAQGQRFWSRQQ